MKRSRQRASTARVQPRRQPARSPERGSSVYAGSRAAALFDGLLSLIRQSNKHLGPRIELWGQQLYWEHALRHYRDGEEVAHNWLVAELRALKLPDRRGMRTYEQDVRLTQTYRALKTALQPLFRQHSQARERKAHAAPVVARILGSSVTPDQLPDARTATAHAYELLGGPDRIEATTVRVSRARGRIHRVTVQQVFELAGLFDAMADALGDQAPVPPERLKQAAAILRGEDELTKDVRQTR